MSDSATFEEIDGVLQRFPKYRRRDVVRLAFNEIDKDFSTKILNRALVANGYSRMTGQQVVAAINLTSASRGVFTVSGQPGKPSAGNGATKGDYPCVI